MSIILKNKKNKNFKIYMFRNETKHILMLLKINISTKEKIKEYKIENK